MEEKTWYEKYLPFVARSPEMQLRWLEAAFRRGTLTLSEITPYIRLFLAQDGEGRMIRLSALLQNSSEDLVGNLLSAADIYDAPDLFRCIARPSLPQAILILGKEPPPYEKKQQAVLGRVFQAVYDAGEELLNEAAAVVFARPGCPSFFKPAYERFKEVKEDEKLLSALYPKAIL